MTPCVHLLGEPFSVVPEAFCRVLDLLMGLIVRGVASTSPHDDGPVKPRAQSHMPSAN